MEHFHAKAGNMDVEEFLKKVVEGYLFHDLESMAKVTVPPSTDGALGYSMMATTLAGIELLGSLLLPNADPYNPHKGDVYFLDYWDNYLVKEQPAYTGLGSLFRKMLRHGIAHIFLAKPGIFIEKGNGRRVAIDTTRQELFIDCNVFYGDFQKSYSNHVRPIIDKTAKSPLTRVANMQSRLDSMITVYLQDANKAFSSLSNLDPSIHVVTSGIRIANINPRGSSRANEYPSPAPTGLILTPPLEDITGITIINAD